MPANAAPPLPRSRSALGAALLVHDLGLLAQQALLALHGLRLSLLRFDLALQQAGMSGIVARRSRSSEQGQERNNGNSDPDHDANLRVDPR
jgi:hypothetical protein